jgi:hypothetical protein
VIRAASSLEAGDIPGALATFDEAIRLERLPGRDAWTLGAAFGALPTEWVGTPDLAEVIQANPGWSAILLQVQFRRSAYIGEKKEQGKARCKKRISSFTSGRPDV